MSDGGRPMTDPWRMDEWSAALDRGKCFVAGCSGWPLDERGPIFVRDVCDSTLVRAACTEHWEAIMRVLGDEATWERDHEGADHQ